MPKIKPVTSAPFFIWSEIIGSDNDDCRPVMLTSREVTVIRQALFPVSYFRTRLGEWVNGLFDYTTDTDVKEEFFNLVSLIDYKLTGDEMTDCFESIGLGLQAIADALKVRCCENDTSDITVNVTDGGNTVTGDITGGPGDDEGEGEVPEGFEDWESYFVHKCQAANAIIDGFVSQLNTFSVMTIVSFVSVSAVLGIAWASFPPAGIVLLVTALVALALGKVYLSQLAEYITDNRDTFVCAIYNGKTTGEAIDLFLAEIDNGIESLSLQAPLPALVRQVVNAMCDGGVFAKLYDVAFEVFYPDADCEDCNEELPTWRIRLCDSIAGEGRTYRYLDLLSSGQTLGFDSQDGGNGYQYLDIIFEKWENDAWVVSMADFVILEAGAGDSYGSAYGEHSEEDWYLTNNMSSVFNQSISMCRAAFINTSSFSASLTINVGGER